MEEELYKQATGVDVQDLVKSGLFPPIEMRNDMRRLSFPLVDGEGLPVGCLSHEGIMSLPTWSINKRSVFLDDIIVPLFTTSKISL